MPLTPFENTPRWTAQIQDMIASDASIREGLHDEDAIPLMDWGRAQAEHVAARLDTTLPDADEEAAGEEAGALIRLMTTISRAVVHRHSQDADWLVKVFARLNKTSERVYGEGAPVMSDDEIATWIAGHAARADGEVLRDLLARFSPPGAEPVSASADSAAPPIEPAAPAPLSAPLDNMLAAHVALSDALSDAPSDALSDTPSDASPGADDLPGRMPSGLPGRAFAAPDTTPPHTGDEHDQE